MVENNIKMTVNAFDAVIGYDEVKKELTQVVDMIHNRELYDRLGAKLPHGILLSGEPGLGKTLLANSFIKATGLNSYVLRKSSDDGKFTEKIQNIFETARENAPAIILFDDMDKFSNGDKYHRNCDEYVAVQAGFDTVKGSDVMVVATINDSNVLPDSLIRAGRFDKKFEFDCLSGEDAKKVIQHYLRKTKLAADINYNDITKMLSGYSCADIETAVNEAAIMAAFERSEVITMDQLVRAIVKDINGCESRKYSSDDAKMREVALHEAGHVVLAEAVKPGCIGFANIRYEYSGIKHGYACVYDDMDRRPELIAMSLAGKAAVELYNGYVPASGCLSDLAKAHSNVVCGLTRNGTRGLGLIDEDTDRSNNVAAGVELERYLLIVRGVLIDNRALLEKVAEVLFDEEILLRSGLDAIIEECGLKRAFIY